MREVETKTQEEIILEERKTQRERLIKRAQDHHDAKRYHIQFVKVKCIATDTGYYANRLIYPEQVFMYDDVLKNGKFPLWCKPVEAFEAEWSKMSELEKAPYLAKSAPVGAVKDDHFAKELELIRKELEMEKALRNEAEERLEAAKTKRKPRAKAVKSPFPEENNSDII